MKDFHFNEKGKKRMRLSMVDTHDRFIECLDDPILKGEEAEKMEKLALTWIEKNMKGQEWPEDDWIALGDDGEYDLNLWRSPEDTPDDSSTWRASVYRVFDGSTDTSRWVCVNLPLSCDEKGKKRIQWSMVDMHDRFIQRLDDPILKGEEAEKMEKLALTWIEKNMKGQEWPEDDWIALGDDGEYDLNLWRSPEDTPDDSSTWRASVYRVFDGSTDTFRWVRVNLPLS